MDEGVAVRRLGRGLRRAGRSGRGPRVADVIAAGYIFETDMADGCWLALDNRLAPLGNAYLLVQDGRGTVASCMFTGFKQQAERLPRLLAATATKFPRSGRGSGRR